MSSHSRSTPQVHQIKAIFEGYRHALAPTHFTRGKSLTSPAADKSSTASGDHTDRSLLSVEPDHGQMASNETLPDAQTRPKLNQKPSWVGRPAPGRLEQSNVQAMKQKVVIQYHATGVQPPVFITTSLSEPQWDIIEMTGERDGDGQWKFHTTFDADEGEYQYKFRLGPGDWWVCDEDQPTIDDDLGNCNNVLAVTRQDEVAPLNQKSVIAATGASDPKDNEHTRSDSGVVHDVPEKEEEEDHHYMPLLKHETTFPGQIEDIPEGTIFSSSPASPAASERLYWEQHRPGSHLAQHPPPGETPSRTVVKRQVSAASSLPKVQEEEAVVDEEEEEGELIMIVSEDEDTSEIKTRPEEDEVPAHGQHDQTKTTQDHDLEAEEGPFAIEATSTDHQPRPRARSNLADLGEIFFGVVFAAVVGVVALVLYSTGLMGHQDIAEDGSAVLRG